MWQPAQLLAATGSRVLKRASASQWKGRRERYQRCKHRQWHPSAGASLCSAGRVAGTACRPKGPASAAVPLFVSIGSEVQPDLGLSSPWLLPGHPLLIATPSARPRGELVVLVEGRAPFPRESLGGGRLTQRVNEWRAEGSSQLVGGSVIRQVLPAALA